MLINADALEALKAIESETVDLVYIDPPYFTNKNWKYKGCEFSDVFENIHVYIAWIKPILEECYRVLKPTGSFYLQCDDHACNKLGALLEDIFGYEGDEDQSKGIYSHIAWQRSQNVGANRKAHTRDVDIIHYFTKSKKWTYDKQYLPIEEDAKVKWCTAVRGYLNGRKDRLYEIEGVTPRNGGWYFAKARLEQMLKDGTAKVITTSKGTNDIIYRYYDNGSGRPVSCIWEYMSDSDTSYPTQKPTKLLQRIIASSSKEGDLVLDPMCGSGTTCAVAKAMGRKYIGIDANPDAIRIATERLISIIEPML